MSQTFSNDARFIAGVECPHFFPGKTGPVIKILLYTDDPVDIKDDLTSDFNLGVMLRHIEAHAPAFASLCFKLVSRNSTVNNHADNRLDTLIQNGEFDQIWFFGLHQGNRENFSIGILRGGPHSELEPEEVQALKTWMEIGNREGQRGGGVLMTGDHAEPRPPDAIEQPGGAGVDEFWGLGRAIGARVPRAGQLRQFVGPPSRQSLDSQNTQVLVLGTNFDEPLLQFDPVPQRLILQNFDTNGQPSETGLPHPLFFYRPESFIQVYPDHMHEGTVVIPSQQQLSDPNVWPNVNIVSPHVIARGTDNSKKKVVDLIAAYDGDQAGVGRIVADSTWHHYFNVNLNRFEPPGDLDSATDQIGTFYGNLTLWLTPIAKRREMADAMISWVANRPAMLEERVLEELSDEQSAVMLTNLGRKAYEACSQVASACEIHELLNMLMPTEVRNKLGTVSFPERGFSVGSFDSGEVLLPSKQLLLGSLTNTYHRRAAQAESSGAGFRFRRVETADNGFELALRVQHTHVARLAAASANWFNFNS